MKLLNFLILNELIDRVRRPIVNVETKIINNRDHLQSELIGITSPLLKVNSFGKIEKIFC